MEYAKITNYKDESIGLEFNTNLFALSRIMKKKVCIFDTKANSFSAKVLEFSFKKSENSNNIVVEIQCDDQKNEQEIQISELAEVLNSARLNGDYPPNSYKLRNIVFNSIYEFMKTNIPNGIMINDFTRKSNILIYNGENILAAIKESSEIEREFMNISVINDTFEFGSSVVPGEYIALDFYGYKNRVSEYPVFPAFNFKFEEIFTRKDLTNKFTFVIYNRDVDVMISIEAENKNDLGLLEVTDKRVVEDFYNVRDTLKENYNNPENIIENIINNRNISSDMNFLFSIE